MNFSHLFLFAINSNVLKNGLSFLKVKTKDLDDCFYIEIEQPKVGVSKIGEEENVDILLEGQTILDDKVETSVPTTSNEIITKDESNFDESREISEQILAELVLSIF